MSVVSCGGRGVARSMCDAIVLWVRNSIQYNLFIEWFLMKNLKVTSALRFDFFFFIFLIHFNHVFWLQLWLHIVCDQRHIHIFYRMLYRQWPLGCCAPPIQTGNGNEQSDKNGEKKNSQNGYISLGLVGQSRGRRHRRCYCFARLRPVSAHYYSHKNIT